ncbi:MAG: universal stress protein [Sedimenticola sp.]|nr:universal stress protein [Sedimenticola sp.]
MRRFKKILCVMAPGSSCRSALERAVGLAESNQATLTVATVAERAPADFRLAGKGLDQGDLQVRLAEAQVQRLETLIDPFRTRADIKTLVMTGTPFLEIIRQVLRKGHDLVIKCPDSPDWLDRFFAGDDMHLLRKCPCPVWMINPESGPSYQRILVAVDVDDNYPPDELEIRNALNEVVMEIAGSLAVSEFAELHVVHAWEAIGESALRNGAFISQPKADVDAYVEQVRRSNARRLDELIEHVTGTLGSDAMEYLKPQLHLQKGAARKEIPALARRLQVDCIVMGTVARTGIRGFFMGNTAETILGQIDCSVLAIKPPGFVTPVALED